ncbi:MAG: glycosyltransferase [Pirellulaceae bacterium]|nr:glycosyltransferase [Pirellulaceae bacterium]
MSFATPAQMEYSQRPLNEFPQRGLFRHFECFPLPPSVALSRRIFSGVPSEVIDLRSDQMSAAIAAAIAQYQPQVLLTSEPGMTPYLEPYMQPHGGKILVLDYLMVQPLSLERLAAISRGFRRLLWKLRWKRSIAYHRHIAPRYDLCLVNSNEDYVDLQTHSPGWQRLEFFPNGLDLNEYPLELQTPQPQTLIYPGSITYLPNRDAVQYMIQAILPRIRQRLPDVKFLVTGAVPADGSAPQGEGVVYTGRVPDVRPVIAGAWACVVPLRSGAGGTRYKVLEAMALGTPIISTTIGAEGVDWTDGQNIIVRDAPDQFAQSTLAVLEDAALRHRLSQQGRQLIEQRYDWNVLGAKLTDLFTELVEKVSQAPGK